MKDIILKIFIIKKYEVEKKEDPEKIRKAQKKWKDLSKKLINDQGIYIIHTIGSILKAVHILEKCETDEKFEETISLGEKIHLYKLSTENEKIIDFLSKASKHKEEKEEDKDEEELENDDILIPDSHPEKITDLSELTSKIESIEKLLKEENIQKEKKLKLEKLLDL